MSDQPEHNSATPDRANTAADAGTPAPSIGAPLILTGVRSAAGGRGRGAASRRSRRKTSAVFDAAAIQQLVDTPSTDSGSPGAAARIGPADAPPVETENPTSEQESQVGEATESGDETVGGPVDAATVAAEDLPSEPDLPTVSVGDGVRLRSGTPKAARRAGRSRPAKRRPSRSWASGWILFGVCGASALLVVALLVNRLNWPAGGAAAPRGGSRKSGTENAAQVPPLPEFKAGEFSRADVRPQEVKPGASSRGGTGPQKVNANEISRTGVRPMDAKEYARRRGGIDSFAEMGRAEEEKLRREKPPAGSPEQPGPP